MEAEEREGAAEGEDAAPAPAVDPATAPAQGSRGGLDASFASDASASWVADADGDLSALLAESAALEANSEDEEAIDDIESVLAGASAARGVGNLREAAGRDGDGPAEASFVRVDVPNALGDGVDAQPGAGGEGRADAPRDKDAVTAEHTDYAVELSMGPSGGVATLTRMRRFSEFVELRKRILAACPALELGDAWRVASSPWRGALGRRSRAVVDARREQLEEALRWAHGACGAAGALDEPTKEVLASALRLFLAREGTELAAGKSQLVKLAQPQQSVYSYVARAIFGGDDGAQVHAVAGASGAAAPQSPTEYAAGVAGGGGGAGAARDGGRSRASTFGAPVRLVTDPPPRSRDLVIAQLLLAQGGACAGCGAPAATHPPVRACAYSRRAYCAACHRNDAEVLPGAVLHSWDFRERRVCAQVADFLQSVSSRPMLNVSAAAPDLYNRVGALARILDLRTWLTRALAAMPPERRARVLAAAPPRRRHLLEDVDTFALADLKDVASGAFGSTLPWLERVHEMVQKTESK
eukprot:PRCOL_00005721-RA